MKDMTNIIVTFEKWPGNWSPPTYAKMRFIDAINWLSKHNYVCTWARTGEGKHFIRFEKPNCKTHYCITIDLQENA